MHNERINILVAPTFFCERHCKYCMYHDLTWDKDQLTVDQIMLSVDDLLYKVAGNLGSVNIGNGGNLSQFSYQYIDHLICRIKQSLIDNGIENTPISILANINSQKDVDLINSIDLNHQISRFCVSLNRERPFNNKTETLLQNLSTSSKSKLALNVVILDSTHNLGVPRLIDYLDRFEFTSITLTEYINTTNNHYSCNVTPEQYYQFVYEFKKSCKNRSYVLDTNDDYRYEIVDLMVSPKGITIVDNSQQPSKVVSGNVDIMLQTVKQIIKRQNINPKCLSCSAFIGCPEKTLSRTKYNNTCHIIRQIAEVL